MGGINGIFAYHYAANPVDRAELVRTRGHMAARGPDGMGEWISSYCVSEAQQFSPGAVGSTASDRYCLPHAYSLLACNCHFRSSIATTAMTANGTPLPWYTYPAAGFLSQRDFVGRRILEFGGGQSTLWWANRAQSVLTIEEGEVWYHSLKGKVPDNVELRHVAADRETRDVSETKEIIEKY